MTNQESLEVASAWVKELDDQRLIGSRNGYGQFKKKNRFDTAKFSDTLKTDERRPPGFLSRVPKRRSGVIQFNPPPPLLKSGIESM